jgi:hypothetical protein
MDKATVHSTATGDSSAAREAKLTEQREEWRSEAQDLESDWGPVDWLILTTFRRTGDRAYWADKRLSQYRGNARRYVSEDIARAAAERLVQRGVIDAYALERIVRPTGGLRSRGEDSTAP